MNLFAPRGVSRSAHRRMRDRLEQIVPEAEQHWRQRDQLKWGKRWDILDLVDRLLKEADGILRIDVAISDSNLGSRTRALWHEINDEMNSHGCVDCYMWNGLVVNHTGLKDAKKVALSVEPSRGFIDTLVSEGKVRSYTHEIPPQYMDGDALWVSREDVVGYREEWRALLHRQATERTERAARGRQEREETRQRLWGDHSVVHSPITRPAYTQLEGAVNLMGAVFGEYSREGTLAIPYGHPFFDTYPFGMISEDGSLMQCWRRSLARLRPTQRLVLIERWGLASGKPETLKEVGAHARLTGSRIREIEQRAFRNIRFWELRQRYDRQETGMWRYLHLYSRQDIAAFLARVEIFKIIQWKSLTKPVLDRLFTLVCRCTRDRLKDTISALKTASETHSGRMRPSWAEKVAGILKGESWQAPAA